MKLYKKYPVASDRMGMLWALNGINDACIIEFGPAGTTHFSIEGLMQLGVDIHAKTFTTHLDEHDVTFGNEERIVDAILEVDKIEKPKYIFVLGSSITSIIGIDLESVKYQVDNDVDSEIIVLPDCDFQSDFRYGVEATLAILVNEITKKHEAMEKMPYYNLLGLGIHDYNQGSDLGEIKRLMKDYFRLELGTTFMLDTTTLAIEESSKAVLNIVINKEGLKAAKLLEEAYDQPYVYITPYGVEGTNKWLEAISDILNVGVKKDIYVADINKITYKENMLKRRMAHFDNKKVTINSNISTTKHLEDYLTALGFEVDNASDHPLILFSDGIEALHNPKAIQIAHPSFKQESDYPYTPMMGYRGAYYLIQLINNTITRAQMVG